MSNRATRGRSTKRIALALLGLALLALGVWWATEPNRRVAVLFEAPVRVTTGATVTGHFEGRHDGLYDVRLQFPGYGMLPTSEDPHDKSGAALAPLAKAVGGDWYGGDAPPGFRASYEIRRGTQVIARDRTGDRLSGFFGPAESGVSIGWVQEDLRGPHEVTVVFEEAVPALASFPARVVVGPGGDYISYAWLEALVRFLLLGLVCLVAGAIGLGVFLARRQRARRLRPVSP